MDRVLSIWINSNNFSQISLGVPQQSHYATVLFIPLVSDLNEVLNVMIICPVQRSPRILILWFKEGLNENEHTFKISLTGMRM